MADPPPEPFERLQQALNEIRANKEIFSEDAFGQIVQVLLERLHAEQAKQPHAPPSSDEIRLVSVMFIDVKDSTRLVQQIGASDWKLIIAQAHDQIAETVSRWDGQIGQYLGDGVLCFFGAQHSWGDDAYHAVSCALAIQQVIEGYAQQVNQQYGITFGVRIGISTGRVVVGMVGGANKQERLALGPATNLASRLQAVAGTGQVFIDAPTYSRIRREFVTQSQPAIMLKGFDKPVKHYQVLARHTQPANQLTENQISGIEMPLIWRDEELALIEYLADEPCFHVATIMGDIGTGKSRLLQEIVQNAEANFQTIVMSAHYETSGQPYNLLRGMLITQCGLNDTMLPGTMRQQIEVYMSTLWPHPDAQHAAAAAGYLAGYDFEAPPGNLFDWVIRWFQGICEKKAICLAVDNLQWADEQSVLLLEQIAQALTHTGGILIAAARPEYRSEHPDYMAAYPHHTRIPLERLPADASRMLIDRVLSEVERVPESVINQIVEHAEGYPLFIREFLSMLFDTGCILPLDDGRWRFNIILLDTALNTVPHGLVSLLQARLDELSPDTRQIILTAAVAGSRFWSGSVAAMTSNSDPAALLKMLEMRGIIVQHAGSLFPGEDEYSFLHTLYRDVAYEMLTRQQREMYHNRMADWLLSVIAGHERVYGALAEHFFLGGRHGAALYTYLEAAVAYHRAGHLADGLALIDQSLAIANRVARDEALLVVTRLWALRGQILVDMGRYEEASAASQSALMLLREIPDNQLVDIRVTSYRMLGLAYIILGRYSDAADALNHAHSLLPASATGQLSTVLRAFGRLMLYQGRLDEAYDYQQRAYALAQVAEDQHDIVLTLTQMGAIHFQRGQLAEALDCFEQTQLISRQAAYISGEAQAALNIGRVYLALMLDDLANEYFIQSGNLHHQLGEQNMLLMVNQAIALLQTGQQAQGRTLLLGAFEHGDRHLYRQQLIHLDYLSGLILLEDFVKSREQAITFSEQTREMNPILYARGQRCLGYSMLRLGDLAGYDVLCQALEAEQTYGGRDRWLHHALIAECSSDQDEKQYHCQQALQLAEQRIDSFAHQPELQARIRSHPRIQAVFRAAGITT